MKKHIIWDYQEPFENEEVSLEDNDLFLEDERQNLDIELENEIIAIADLGLWNGRVMGYKLMNSNNISECLQSDYEPTWYVDENNDFRCDDHHHDGKNYILYREFRSGISDRQKENFIDKIYNGKATEKDIEKYTKKIGDRISKIYGWV